MGQAVCKAAGGQVISDGDARVVAHPSFREVPKCLFPLSTQEGQAEYDTIARVMFDGGRLTLGAHRSLSSYAMQFDVITKTSREGRPIRGLWFAQLDKARKELALDDLDKPIAAPANAPANKFARTGFSNRR